MNLEQQWPAIKKLFWNTFLSSLACSIASVDENGAPHVTPIGTVILREPGEAIFFEKFTTGLPANLKRDNKVCVMAVDSGRLFWLKALISGNFSRLAGIRLYGTVSPLRNATPVEINLWQRRVKLAGFTKGYKYMWADMTMVREIHFTRAEPLNLGKMKQNY